MGIRKFLLARIAEDETEAQDAIEWREQGNYVNPAMATMPDMSLRSWPDVGVPAVLAGPERVIAECEAKRRIIELAKRHLPAVVYTLTAARDRHGDFDQVLRAMATVYADHPDYDPEWS